MSQTIEPDMTLWAAYKAECKAEGMKPSLKDYLVWLEEADMDRKDYYEGNDV